MKELEDVYRARYDRTLAPLAKSMELQLVDLLRNMPRIDRVTARAKSVERFLAKAGTMKDGALKYTEPLRQIQDQIGARIVTFYPCDVPSVAAAVQKYYRAIESKSLIPDNEWEFGYFGRHFIFFIPTDLIDPAQDKDLLPEFFELQVKTLFQHAWAEANHDLGYKPGSFALTSDEKRLLAYTSAQAWGADRVFDDLFQAQERKRAANSA